MKTIDTTKLAPAEATTLALPRKRARVDLPTVNGREVSIWLSVAYEESTRAYHGYLTRTVHQIDGDQSTLLTAGKHDTQRASIGPQSRFGTQRTSLLAVTSEPSQEQLDALYERAYLTLNDLVAAGDEKVTNILADTTEQ